jgi:CRP-like cAMP-binding protein
MVLDRKAFTELLGPLHELLDRNLGVRVISAVPLLTNLSAKEREAVVSLFRTRSFDAGEVLVRAGEVTSHFFVVKSGSVSVTRGRDRSDMIAGGYFGEQALVADSPSELQAMATDKSECFVLDRREFERDLGPLSVSGLVSS